MDGTMKLQEGLEQIRTAERYAGNSNRHMQSVEEQILDRLNG